MNIVIKKRSTIKMFMNMMSTGHVISFQQSVDIPMGTSYTPLFADLFLSS
jgi:hypothetical protein